MTLPKPTGSPSHRIAQRAGRMTALFLLAAGISAGLLRFGFSADAPGAGRGTTTAAPGEISDFDARLTLARSLANDSKLEDAAREYGVLLKQKPDDLVLHCELAHVLMRQQKHAAAMEELHLVLARDPAHEGARLLLAKILLWEKNYPKAIALFEEILKNQPDHKEALQNLALAYKHSGQWDQALRAAQRFAEKYGADAEMYAETGDIHLGAGRLKDAIEWYRKAAAQAPDSEPVRLKLALALAWNTNDAEAEPLLEALFEKQPEDTDLLLQALVGLHLRKGEAAHVRELLTAALARKPDAPLLLVGLADLELDEGRAARARDLYVKALQNTPDDARLRLRYANRCSGWGDFYGAEKICAEYLKSHPGDLEASLELARLYSNMQRYEESETAYRRLLRLTEARAQAFRGLVRVKVCEKDFASAIRFADEFLVQSPAEPAMRLLKAEALTASARYEEALAAYDGLEGTAAQRRSAALGKARVHLKAGHPGLAGAEAQKVLEREPNDVEAAFLLAMAEGVAPEKILREATGNAANGPKALHRWAELLAGEGFLKEAIAGYEAGLQKDPGHFPCRIGLAEALASHRKYDDAIAQFKTLAADFPKSSKILIEWARVLGWSRRFQEAIDLYAQIKALNPQDPVPRKERARTAAWDKRMRLAEEEYRALQTPPVDRQLAAAIEGRGVQRKPTEATVLRGLQQRLEEGSIWQGTEELVRKAGLADRADIGAAPSDLDRLVADLYGTYRIQKAADLEWQAKRAAYEMHYTHARRACEALLELAPGNEEILFDYAQAQENLQLHRGAEDTYRRLLQIDPLHNLAGLALARQITSRQLELSTGWRIWEEGGRDGLSGITRQRVDVGVEIPFDAQYRLRILGHHWEEDPKEGNREFSADGPGLVFSAIPSAQFQAEAGWTYKNYYDREIRSLHNGFVHTRFNFDDLAVLGLDYDRTEEISNLWGIQQAVQADSGTVMASSHLTRRFRLDGLTRWSVYNDGNQLSYHRLEAGYAVLEHPTELRFFVWGEYRNAQEQSLFEYQGPSTVGIRHPYWTPDNYNARGFGLAWRHDLSSDQFAGSELHCYNLKLSFCDDSEENPALKAEWDWHWEFCDHWTLTAGALIHRSFLWNAYGANLRLGYRF